MIVGIINMRFCILTEIKPSIKHGMGKYIEIIKNTLGIRDIDIFNVFEINDSELIKINQYDCCLVHIGLLKKNQIDILNFLKKISIKKIATIHSVLKTEVEYFKEFINVYFPNNTDILSGIDVIDDSEYQLMICEYDALIFNTQNDRDIFLKHYKFDGLIENIIPPLEHLFKPHSNSIKKNNQMSYMGRLDYRKGLIATLNSFEFLPNDELDIYGLIMDRYNQIILKHFTEKNRNITYKGLVKDRSDYFNKYSIFFGNSLYEPLGFSHLEHLFNYVTPIIGKNTGTSEVFGESWPFQVGDSVPELINCVDKIKKTNLDDLKNQHDFVINNLKKYTTDYYKSKLFNLIYKLK